MTWRRASNRLRPALRHWVQGLGEVLFPPSCVHCGGLVERSESGFRHLCAACAALVDYVKPPCCGTCGHPYFGEVEGERMCPHCEGLEPAFNAGCTATLFRGPVRSLVLELKYHHGVHVAHDAEAIFRRSEHVLAFVRDAILVPVPLHPRKERERTYNQSVLLAEALVRASNGSARIAPLLRRDVDTETQTAFDRRARMGNLKNAFALVPGASINPPAHYILVDDVFTTGSTLNSCARVLRRAGALKLGVVTLGHG